jgi:hypothetical protein
VDEDLEGLTHDQLLAEARKLRVGIRAHRDSTGHELCWHHPELWGLLPDSTDAVPTSRHGRSSSAVACGIANLSISSCLSPLDQTLRMTLDGTDILKRNV